MQLSDITEAMRPIAADYLDDVRDIARAVLDRSGFDDDTVEAYIHEAVDGSWWVIYTYAAQVVCLISENSDAIEDADASAAVSDNAINWSAIAYYAMAADVRDEINRSARYATAD